MAATSKLTVDIGFNLGAAVKDLLRRELLVGIPGDGPARPPEPGEKTPPTNALIGYVQEFGDEERGTPARPFLMPGIEAAKAAIVGELAGAGIVALHGGSVDQIKAHFDAAGLIAQASVKKALLNGAFAPLSERTIEARARRRNKDTGKLRGDKASREARQFLKLQSQGVPNDVLHGAGLAQPLYDTQSLFQSITYVVATDRARAAGTAAVAAALGL